MFQPYSTIKNGALRNINSFSNFQVIYIAFSNWSVSCLIPPPSFLDTEFLLRCGDGPSCWWFPDFCFHEHRWHTYTVNMFFGICSYWLMNFEFWWILMNFDEFWILLMNFDDFWWSRHFCWWDSYRFLVISMRSSAALHSCPKSRNCRCCLRHGCLDSPKSESQSMIIWV